MELIHQINLFVEFILNLIFTIEFLIISISLVILIHILLYFIRDKKYIAALRKFEDVTSIKFENFRELPLINVIIPAWKEGDVFQKCLSNISTLKYPNLKIIVNVGGNEETINIANSFKNNENFRILFQQQGEGKIKAINDCISEVSEGLICLIDADVYLTDEDLFKILYVIENNDVSVVASPLKMHQTQVKKIFVRYLYIDRNTPFRIKFTRYARKVITQCTIIKFEAKEKIGKFTEKRLMDDGQSMGLDIAEKNIKIYQLNSQGVQSFNYPDNLKEYSSQNVRWTQNSYFNVVKKSKKKILIFILSTLKALYLIVFPLFLFLNLGLFLLGILLLIYIYLKKIRKILFFRKTSERSYFGKNHIWFYFSIIFFIYLDNLIRIYIVLEIIFKGDKNLRKRKNIELINR